MYFKLKFVKCQIIVVILSIFVSQSQSIYSIDDGILFRMNFPGRESPEKILNPENSLNPGKSPNLEKSLNPEVVTVPANDPMPESNPSSDFETILMTTKHNEQYHCTLPKLDSKADKSKEPYTGPNALDILEKLFVGQSCAYRIEHYWTYELCHGKFLRQFHEERDGKKIKVTEYFLGRYTKEQFDSETKDLKKSFEQGTLRKPPKKKIETMNLPYYELQMGGGTLCDLTGLPRTTRVQYVCYQSGNHEIYSFKESSTCEYEVIILSNMICNHPDYQPEQTNEQIINCVPANAKTARKPLDLITMETEALQFKNTNKMFEAQIMPGQKGPGSVKIEIKSVNPRGSEDEEDEPVFSNPREDNWKALLRREPLKPLMDPEVVQAFLLGEHCLHGGSGWWKYEFCYGKSVDQYHEGKGGRRETVINLGRFNEEKHLEWIDKNVGKRPKPKANRKFVSHFYSGGDLCDVTGIPRHIEVKLKCKPSDSPSAVSLYLLEPKTCEYILGIESPLVCDILPYADDHHGLMEVNPDFFVKQHKDGSKTEQIAQDQTQEPPTTEPPNHGFTPPENVVRFTPEDAVKSPYGDPQNIPATDDNVVIITDYQDGSEATDYDDDDEEKTEYKSAKIP